MKGIDAVTFDFYGTLVYPRAGRGRGAVFVDYLREHGLEADPWEHQVLYDVFQGHDVEYDPGAQAEKRGQYHRRFTERLFRRLNVRRAGGRDASAVRRAEPAEDHVVNVWRIFGPECLRVYPDASGTLAVLRSAGYPLALVSNWQCGLRHFCTELGLGDAFSHVLASAEVGCAKPNPGIFEEVCRRLDHPAERVLHVGDSPVDDVEGALGAGLEAVFLDRDRKEPAGGRVGHTVPTIHGLAELPRLLNLERAVS